jgi:hypothetical protein
MRAGWCLEACLDLATLEVMLIAAPSLSPKKIIPMGQEKLITRAGHTEDT